jgi:hypothetical protein
MHVRMIAGGTADWEKPVRVGEDQWRANYQTFLATRFSFENGRHVHVKTRYSGVDDINLDGTVTGGFGHIEGRDQDDDWMYGRVDWEVRGDYEGGIYTFTGGTGKWKDVSGEIRAAVWAVPEDFDQVLPADAPIRFYGFIDGEGELAVPNLGA